MMTLMICGLWTATRLSWREAPPFSRTLCLAAITCCSGRLVWEVLFPDDLARAGIHTMQALPLTTQSRPLCDYDTLTVRLLVYLSVETSYTPSANGMT